MIKKRELCEPHKETLVVKLLGKTIGYKTMQHKLIATCKLVGGFELMDVDTRFYIIKFELEEDRQGQGNWRMAMNGF